MRARIPVIRLTNRPTAPILVLQTAKPHKILLPETSTLTPVLRPTCWRAGPIPFRQRRRVSPDRPSLPQTHNRERQPRLFSHKSSFLGRRQQLDKPHLGLYKLPTRLPTLLPRLYRSYLCMENQDRCQHLVL